MICAVDAFEVGLTMAVITFMIGYYFGSNS